MKVGIWVGQKGRVLNKINKKVNKLKETKKKEVK